jgi:hypothetical protein
MATDTRIDPVKLREAGRAALAELDLKHEVIAELQDVIDAKWHEAYGIEARLKAILVHLGAMSADDRFDENAAHRVLSQDATPEAARGE